MRQNNARQNRAGGIRTHGLCFLIEHAGLAPTISASRTQRPTKLGQCSLFDYQASHLVRVGILCLEAQTRTGYRCQLTDSLNRYGKQRTRTPSPSGDLSVSNRRQRPALRYFPNEGRDFHPHLLVQCQSPYRAHVRRSC